MMGGKNLFLDGHFSLEDPEDAFKFFNAADEKNSFAKEQVGFFLELGILRKPTTIINCLRILATIWDSSEWVQCTRMGLKQQKI